MPLKSTFFDIIANVISSDFNNLHSNGLNFSKNHQKKHPMV